MCVSALGVCVWRVRMCMECVCVHGFLGVHGVHVCARCLSFCALCVCLCTRCVCVQRRVCVCAR